MYWLLGCLAGAGCYQQPVRPDLGVAAREVIALRKDGNIVCSGFWIGPYHALTAKHCLRSFDSVTDWAGRPLKLINFRSDPDTDIGLLTLQDKREHKAAVLTAHMPAPGRQIWAIGHQMGQGWWYTSGLSSGVREGLFRFSAPVMPGSSGGPVFTETGAVCGVAVSMQQYPAQMLPGLFVLMPVTHMGFAVPANKVLQFLRRVLP